MTVFVRIQVTFRGLAHVAENEAKSFNFAPSLATAFHYFLNLGKKEI